MRVYITRANSMKILRKLDYNNLNIEGNVYSKPIFFLNKREEQALLAYKEFMMNPEKFIEEMIYQEMKKDNDFISNYSKAILVFDDDIPPCYHKKDDCERLHSDYKNYVIPQAIRNKGIDVIEKFRTWFKANLYLLDGKEDIFEMRIYSAFGVRVKIEEIIKDNSGTESLLNSELSKLENQINNLLKEAGKYYYANSKHTKILKQYSKFAFLGTYNEPLYNNNTGYSDEEVKSFLVIYEEKFKRPIKDMLRNYYRVKFNPELEMEGYLLDQLGFRPCSHCFA